MLRNIEHALEYARRGWHVFPLVPGGKTPLPGGRGHHDATTDAARIAAWWTETPDANIGVALEPSGLVALDADRHGKVDGVETLKGMRADLSRTLAAATGGNGVHLIYARGDAPAVRKIHWRPGLDLLATGYVVVAPSVLETGTAYAWRNNVEPAQLPEILRTGLSEKTISPTRTDTAIATRYGPASDAVLAAARARLERHGPAIKGQGGDQHTFAVGAILLHGYALAEEEAWDLAVEWNDRNTLVEGNPKWSESRLAAKLRNGARYASGIYGLERDAVEFDATGFGAPPAPPSEPAPPPIAADLHAHYRAVAKKFASGKTAARQADHAALTAVLGNKQIPNEITVEVAARALVRNRPEGATDDQLLSLLVARWNPTAAAAAIAAVPAPRPRTDTGPRDKDGFLVYASGPSEGKPIANQENTRHAFDLLGLKFRYDLMADRAEMNGAALLEHAVVALRFRIDTEYKFKIDRADFFDLVQTVAREDSYHPVLEYLSGLKWDGRPRLDRWLITYAGAAPEDPEHEEYLETVGRLVLTAAVRRVRSPGCKFDEMLVIESPMQGTFKSSALAVLAGNPEWFTDKLPLARADTQKRLEATIGKWIVEVSDLAGLKSADRDDIKQYLSSPRDRCRGAYKRMTESVDRQWVPIGTTNRKDYLGDPSGERRTWPVEIVRFDIAALERDRDQLWAEAATIEATGASIRLPEHLWAVAARQQEERYQGDPIEDKLAAALDGKIGNVTEADLLALAGFEDPDKGAASRLGAAMRRIQGWVRVSRKRVGNGHRAAIWSNTGGGAGKLFAISELRPAAGFVVVPSGATPEVPVTSSK